VMEKQVKEAAKTLKQGKKFLKIKS
jgi:hypothetical protein